MTGILLGFQLAAVSLPLDQILASKKLNPGLTSSRKYKQISASIAEIGLIEPLSVSPVGNSDGMHLLLDGHTRLLILQDLGHTEAPCLISKDDETYTYNSRINRLSTIQEHHMIRRAVERGVSPERLAKVLSVDLTTITRKLALLEGICPEAIEMLKDRQFSHDISRVLRKMKPTRQLECVELMVSANNVTIPYANALLVATPAAFLVDGKKPEKLNGVSPEQMARMEREMENLQNQYKMVEENYGQDVLNLVLARGYLTKIMDNPAVTRYLRQNFAEVLDEFDAIVQASSLE